MQFWSLEGLTDYEDARLLQLKLVELRAREAVPDTVLFLEHEPVLTRGRGLQFSTSGDPGPRHMPVPALPPGIKFAETERGGDLTYHGPGQLVIYPVVKLDGKGFGPNRDVTAFLRKFEQVLVEELEARGLQGRSKPGAAGVWAGDRKLASIGIAVRAWVVYHGMAINAVNDLSPFQLFSPCGFSPEVMTRLADLLPGFGGPGWRNELELSLTRRMSGAEPRIQVFGKGKAFAEAMALDPGLTLAR